LLSCALIVL